MVECIDNALALIHHLSDQANSRQREIRDDIAISSSQLQELVETVKQLSDDFNDDKKGGEKEKICANIYLYSSFQITSSSTY